ncbi:hypothetical protein [Mycolicibacterium vinylchloridicum]|uniref:hypothetical protein n=1 Tax=Mycolicibacterium vinylchloridicum TaxID=2736928 RepID=UPI0015CA4F52|nr:hypothetical protein [Mycolicibacterium vinylchloridicum]
MKKMTIATAFVGALTAAALCPAATAAADSTNAADVVKMLQDQGYNVQFNMPSNMTLNRCTVTGVHGLVVMMMSDGQLMVMTGQQNPGSVYVDLSCASDSNN